jgi:DNA-binding transcriptional ArsR family regulator
MKTRVELAQTASSNGKATASGEERSDTLEPGAVHVYTCPYGCAADHPARECPEGGWSCPLECDVTELHEPWDCPKPPTVVTPSAADVTEFERRRDELTRWSTEMQELYEMDREQPLDEVELHTVDEIIAEAENIVAEAATATTDVDEPPLPMETPTDILEGGGDGFDAVIENLAYRRLKTLVVGRAKNGKSYLLWAKSAEIVRDGARVLFLTEESPSTISDKLHLFGLEDAEGFWVVRRTALPAERWNTVAKRVAETVARYEVDLVIVDTARAWFNLASDESNSADIIGPAIDALSEACGGAGIVVLHQSPWGGNRARGSTEFHAAVDLIFAISGEGAEPRTIKYVGGRVGSIPDVQTLRLVEGVGEDLGALRHDTAASLSRVLDALEKSGPMTVADLVAETGASDDSVRRWLKVLERSGKVHREPGVPTPDGRTADRWLRNGYFGELAALTDRVR